MESYVAGEFYSKYCMENGSDIGRIIIVEYPVITKIMDFCRNNLNDSDEVSIYRKDYDRIEKLYKEDPHEFSKSLKKLGKLEWFFKYIIEIDKLNALYQTKEKEKKSSRRREMQIITYTLAVGTLLGILTHQLWIILLL